MNVLIVDDDIEFSQKLKNDFIINFRMILLLILEM